MDKDRYNATVEHRNKKVNVPEEFLQHKKESIEKAEALQSLQQHYGWKILLEEFIEPRLSIERFIRSDPSNLQKIQAQVLILQELLNWISGKQHEGRYDETLVNRIKNLEEEK
jgi:hypothetical protein